jgi:hypothetical protein
VDNGRIDDMELQAFTAHCAAGNAAVLHLKAHQLAFVPGGPVLVVTFEPAANRKREDDFERQAWAQRFVLSRGHSLLGVKRATTDWYRSPDLHRALRHLQETGFFQRFAKVVFYGPSMGGYAALAFAACAPGCTVIAMNPQSTLAPDIVWFDQRFAGKRALAWRGDFVDGARGAEAASRVYVCYDPWQTKDRLHAQRLPAHNRVDLRLPFTGHVTAQVLQSMGLLGKVFDEAVAGTLDPAWFHQAARQRVQLPGYWLNLSERGVHLPRKRRLVERALQLDPTHADALNQQALLQEFPVDAAAPAKAGGWLGDATPVRRWPSGIVTAARVPLIYLTLPKSGSTTIQNHLLYMASGARAEQPKAIHDHPRLLRSRQPDVHVHAQIGRQIVHGALVFTFVREPARRLFACFVDKVMGPETPRFLPVRRALVRHWGLRTAPGDEQQSLDEFRANFEVFLSFVEANLAGRTHVPLYSHWTPQTTMLSQFKKHVRIDVVGRLESFQADMAHILHRSGARRLPDLSVRPWLNPPPPHAFEQVVDAALLQRIEQLYEPDYVHLKYPRSAVTTADVHRK